jgi:protein TonB
MIGVAANLMATSAGYRGRISALASALLHTLMLGLFAATSIRIATEDRRVIPLVIRDPAPPPPPPGVAGPGPPASAVVASDAKFLEARKPLEAPKPVEKPRIAAKPKPKRDTPRKVPTPAAASAPTPAAVAAAPVAGGDAGSGVTGGVMGGVPGGQVGGKVGGRLGGSGDDVWSVDQVAVPPKVLESVRPQYPPVARARGQEGVVIVQAIIDRGGGVETEAVQVVKSQPPFDEAAVKAFRQWKFQPGRDDSGQNVRVLVQQPIRFQLR